ncbi:hypothetical protein L9F63_013248 [Diploptera punctata]|uniref:Uncharacterized protein n=1 Tax=Diploptera punctata TaxID=6984 RepID=A0AAD8AAM2_DIPPU|nr:hypothetical protein L9F63_013248 [Diploptera punctata]
MKINVNDEDSSREDSSDETMDVNNPDETNKHSSKVEDSNFLGLNESNGFSCSGKKDEQCHIFDEIPFDEESNNETMVVCLSDEDSDELNISCSGEKDDEYYKLLARIEKKYQLSDEMKKKLTKLDIRLSHDIPKSHTIDMSLTKVPKKENRHSLIKLRVKLNDNYDPEEDKIIEKNWKQFCKEYEFEDPHPFMVIHHDYRGYITRDQHVKFVQYLGNGLPLRTLYSIYSRFCYLYTKTKSGRYSEDEDNFIILHYMRGNEEKALSTISGVLGRTKKSVWLRIKVLRQQHKGIMRWNMKYANDVVKQLMLATKTENIKDLENKKISREIWIQVGKKCSIHPKTVKQFWENKLSTMLYAQKPIYLSEVRIKLLRRLFKSDISNWNQINWSDIAKTDFEGVHPKFLKSVFKKLLKIYYPNKKLEELINSIEDIIIDLRVQHLESIKKMDEYCLQKLRVNRHMNLKVKKK